MGELKMVSLKKESEATMSGKVFTNILSVAGMLLAVGSVYYGGKLQSIYHFLAWFMMVLSITTIVISSPSDLKAATKDLRWWHLLASVIHWSVYLYFGWHALFVVSFIVTSVVISFANQD